MQAVDRNFNSFASAYSDSNLQRLFDYSFSSTLPLSYAMYMAWLTRWRDFMRVVSTNLNPSRPISKTQHYIMYVPSL